METGNQAESIDRIEIRHQVIHDAGADLVIRKADAVRALDHETVNNLILVADDGGFIIIEKLI